MSTKVYRSPPVTPDAHLEQMAALREAKEEDLSEFQVRLRRSVLSQKALKKLRKMYIWEMIASGYQPEQIKLTFIAPNSPLNVLVDGLKGDAGARVFKEEILEAVEQHAKLGANAHREIYIQDRQRLLNACWGFLGSVQPSQAKALMELMGGMQQDIATARGIVHQRAGKRPSVRQPASSAPPAKSTEAPVEGGDTEPAGLNWEGEFVADDSEDSVPTPE